MTSRQEFLVFVSCTVYCFLFSTVVGNCSDGVEQGKCFPFFVVLPGNRENKPSLSGYYLSLLQALHFIRRLNDSAFMGSKWKMRPEAETIEPVTCITSH